MSIGLLGAGGHDGYFFFFMTGNPTTAGCTFTGYGVPAFAFGAQLGTSIFYNSAAPFVPPEIGSGIGTINNGACPLSPRSGFATYSRWSMRLRTSTYHLSTNSFDADGSWAIYFNNVVFASQTNVVIDLALPFGGTAQLEYAASPDASKFWAIQSAVAPPTDATGTIIGSPANLLFYDDFTSGIINPATWTFNNGAQWRNNTGIGATAGVTSISNPNPTVDWWDCAASSSLLKNITIPAPAPTTRIGTWSRAWKV